MQMIIHLIYILYLSILYFYKITMYYSSKFTELLFFELNISKNPRNR